MIARILGLFLAGSFALALPGNINDRQYQSFTDNHLGRVARRVVLEESGVVQSAGNSSTATIGASGSFIGTAEVVSQYPEITVNLFGEPSVAPGTLYFEFSPNGTNWDISVPYTLAGPQSFVALPLRVVLPYFRVRYINGSTPLTTFRLTTVYHHQPAKMLTRVVNQTIDENEPVENVRNVNMGKSPDGPYTNLPSTGVSSAQSTNTLLGISGVFNAAGPISSTQGFSAVALTVKSDVVSASMGVVFQWYADAAGTRLVKEGTFTYGTPNIGIGFSVPVQGPYFRVKYTNGITAQTSFEFLVQFFVDAPPPDVVAVSDTITGNNAAQIVKANIVGLQENGVYANSKLSNSSSQMVAIADRPSEVRARTRVIIPVNRTSVPVGATTLYTVTAGKILYISAFSFTMLNDNIAVGEWRLRDSTTVRAAYIMTSRVAGTASAAAAASPTLPEPMPFSTNVNAILITGTIDIAGFLIGYEE
jgi:hypothetical protein